MDFQKYNIKEKKQKEKGRKKKKRKKTHKNYFKKNIKNNNKTKNKKSPTTIQRLYMVFALKKKVFFFKNSNSRL